MTLFYRLHAKRLAEADEPFSCASGPCQEQGALWISASHDHREAAAIKNRTLLVAYFALAPLVVIAAWALVLRNDPRELVPAIELGGMDLPVSTHSGDDPERAYQVAALDRLEGTLVQRGDGPDDFYLSAIELEFGPEEWLVTAGAIEDYDGDGQVEDLYDELQDLVGQSVAVLVRLDGDGDEADVFSLNDLTYRDSVGGPAPWQQSPPGMGPIATPEEVARAALRAVGPGARVAEIDPASAGVVAWEVDVIDAAGIEQSVLLNAAGVVLDVRPDD